ncbi:MAG TPA: hypothetical protein VEB19_03640 [Gemmatimonadaceae bacterium]|nr:hypothetical protein [Gemmatimonadaceae bacterium]
MLFIAALLFIQVQADTSRPFADTSEKREVRVSVRAGDRKREPRRIPVTDEHRRTAYKTPLAGALLNRARVARMSQDSALISYEATSYLRISAKMAISKLGRERLIFRHENASNVKWHRETGAWLEVKGSRTAIPIIPRDEEKKEAADALDDPDMFAIPYYPGQEPLLTFSGTEVVKSQVDESELVNPIAEGAEAYYTYSVGDSVSLRLPDGTVIQLRELDVRPREPKWNVVVGSLWFDVSSGQLVRAAYRLAVPIDIWAQIRADDPGAGEDIPVFVKPMISPMRAQVKAIAVEYGLYQGRFWLPRSRSAEGDAQVSFARFPFKFEQAFKYASVNMLDTLPTIRIVADSIRLRLRDSVHDCDRANDRIVTKRGERGSNLKIGIRIPCNVAKLQTSPELPKSIYDDGEEIFGSIERDALMKEALAMGAQAPVSPGSMPPTIEWGLPFTRFNRVEGLSSGLQVSQIIGGGYTASASARIGIADLEPNAELSLSRSNMSTTVRGAVYNRLVSASDWGNPLSFGSSVSALVLGRDDGFYYRTSGAEIGWALGAGAVSWRVFAEHHRTAAKEVDKTLGPAFIPNVVAREGGYAGVATRVLQSYGLDPNGFRAFTDARFETALSDSAASFHGRGAVDLTVSRGFGSIASALTVSAGSSVGELPSHRHWFLGGAHTIRGQRADTAVSGNAFWMGRIEFGTAVQGVRPVVFGDIGWTGDRNRMADVGRPLSGAGVGASFLDGMIRFDVARGLYPEKRVRLYLYLDAKF